MRRTDARRCGTQTVLWAITALALVGAGTPSKKKRSEPPPKVEETIGDIAFISTPADQKLEGVGLVVGLDGTGGDAPGSWRRTKLIEEMRKASVDNPNKLLADKRFSMVVVKLKVPTGVGPADRLDVEVEVPPGSPAKSLAGGYLLHCRLKETLVLGGTPKEGPELAVAQGPVLIGTETSPDSPKVGRVLGGARVKKDTPFHIVIKENRRSFRTSRLLEDAVNQRFPLHEGVELKGVAEAKTDHFLVLKIPHVYHHNHFRYFRVIKLLPVVDNPDLQRQRLAAWGKDLLDPTKAGIAALRLEGMGVAAIDTLKQALASPNAQVQFLAAEALAYLGDGAGSDILGDNIVRHPEFRAHALNALAACGSPTLSDQTAARTKLIKLMDVPDVEVRYGAFNALRTLDENDPFLGRVRVLDEPDEPEEESESMSIAIAKAARRRRGRVEDPFFLYLVDCEGPPMIHVARTRRSEIVVFGRDQKLLTPIVLGTGPILLNAADGDESLQISRIGPARADESDAKVASSLDIGDVLRQTANLGAKYPDVVSILQAAYKQKNLPGPLVVDAVPVANPLYDAAAIFGKDTTKKDDALLKTKLDAKKKRGILRRFLSRGDD